MQTRIRWTLGAVALSALALIVAEQSDHLSTAAAATLLGLVAIGVAYSIWSALHPRHWCEPWRFLHDIFNPVVLLLALLGVALVIQGISELGGWEGLDAVGRIVVELFGGS